MPDFTKIQKDAAIAWKNLQNSPEPVVYLGMGTCGLASGAGEVWNAVESIISGADRKVRLVKVGCIGPCYLEPLLDIQLPGSPRLCFNNVDPQRAEKLIEEYIFKGEPKLKPLGHFGRKDEKLNGTRSFWNLPMIKTQERIVLRNCGIVDPENIMHYIAREGFQGLINAFHKSPQDVIGEMEASGLREEEAQASLFLKNGSFAGTLKEALNT